MRTTYFTLAAAALAASITTTIAVNIVAVSVADFEEATQQQSLHESVMAA